MFECLHAGEMAAGAVSVELGGHSGCVRSVCEEEWGSGGWGQGAPCAGAPLHAGPLPAAVHSRGPGSYPPQPLQVQPAC